MTFLGLMPTSKKKLFVNSRGGEECDPELKCFPSSFRSGLILATCCYFVKATKLQASDLSVHCNRDL